MKGKLVVAGSSMRFGKSVVCTGLTLLFLHLTATAAFSQAGFIKILNFPGSTLTAPQDINNRGEIVGIYNDINDVNQGFLYCNGTFTSYSVPDATSTQIRGINNHGDFVGTYVDSQNQNHGFLRDHSGQVTTLDFYGVNQTLPNGINDQGTITGLYIDNNQVAHYFVYANGQAVQIDVPNATIPSDFSSWPKINNSGSLVGTVVDNDSQQRRAVLVSNGVTMTFGVNGDSGTGARAINSAGAITGPNSGPGYVLANGKITIFQVPGISGTQPRGINDKRQVTGIYSDANGTHGFIMQMP